MTPKDGNKKKLFSAILLISCAGLICASALLEVSLFSSLNNKVFDSLFHARGPLQDTLQAVAIVAIDEQSLEKIGGWPWPRPVLAALIARIKQAGARVIGIDLLLDLPSTGQDAKAQDAQLAEVLKVPPVCVLPVVAQEQQPGKTETLFNPLDIFLTGHTVTGAVNVEPDPADKITREFKAIYGTMPSFPLAVCLEYLGASFSDVRRRRSYVEFGDYRIPTREQRALINYTCAHIDSFSAGDVLEPSFDAGFFFRDKIVLLGRTDLASKDFVNTPVPSGRIFETLPMAGIEVWKEIIDMILARNFLYGVPPFFSFLIAVIASILICAVTLHSNKGGAAVSAVCIGLGIASFYLLFLKKNIILPVVYFAAVCGISYVFSFLYNFVVFQREKRKIAAAFKSYISPQLLQHILSQRIDLSVGARRKTLTMLFADVKGFTSFSDTHGPEEVLAFLKAFFAEMNRVIIGHGGIVNKLMGDGILAFFGDFTDSDTHARDAVCAAIEMQKHIPGLQKRLGFDLQIRIGVHTGQVDVGNIGSAEHLDYTVIGSNVNLAQRLEANCEPGKVLISEATYQAAKDVVEISDTREIPLKGFAVPVKVCTVAGLKVK